MNITPTDPHKVERTYMALKGYQYGTPIITILIRITG